MLKRCKDIIKGVSEIYDVQSEITITGGTAGGDSDKEISDMIYELAKISPFIDDDKIIKEKDFGACEDYAHFMHSVQKSGGKSGYVMIGTNLSAGHHNSKFDINEDSMLAGVDLFLRAAYKINSK